MEERLKALKKFVNWLKGFAYLFNSELYGDVNTVIQFNVVIEGTALSGYFEIVNGRANFEPGEHEKPNVSITLNGEAFLELLKGKTSPQKLWLTKRVKIEGEKEYFFAFPELFSRKIFFVEWNKEKGITFDVTRVKKQAWRKPDKVLVLNGSARQRKGFTWAFLQHLIEGMKRAGAEVEVIDIYNAKLKINPCYGCFECWTRTLGECIIKDDAAEIIEKIGDSYLTVFATPLYLYSVPAKFKALLDRIFIELQPFLYPEGNYTKHPLWKNKERYMALFAISGYPEIEVFNPLREMFRGISRDADIPLIAEILRPGAWLLKTLIQYRGEYKRVANALDKAGEQLVEKGKVDNELLEIIARNYIPKDQYYTYNNLFWIVRYSSMKR